MNDKLNVGSAALAGLVGHYGSGDSDDESGDDQAVSTATSYANHSSHDSIWSICVDPSTGCPYYWNQITNEVSWEPPPGYITSPVVLSNSAKLSVTSKQKNLKNRINQCKDQSTKIKHSDTNVYKTHKKHKHSSDEEEKIELITSYHHSDSGSGEENDARDKNLKKLKLVKKNIECTKQKETIKVPLQYGPELPKDFLKKSSNSSKIENSHKKSEISSPSIVNTEINKNDDLSNSLSNYKPEIDKKLDGNILVSIISNENNRESTSSPISSRNSIKKSDEAFVSNHEKGESNELDHDETSNIENKNIGLEKDNLNELILTQAKLLKKLGKLDANELKYLNCPSGSPIIRSRTQSPIGSPTIETSVPLKKSSALDMDVDDLIAQIEMEQPIDKTLATSDTHSTETGQSQDNSITNKFAINTEESSESKTDNSLKPLFPSVNFTDLSENNQVDIQNEDKSEELKSVDDSKNDPSEKNINKYEITGEEGMDNNILKRKRRIALDILPVKKQAVEDINFLSKYISNSEELDERKGLGFKMHSENSSELEENKTNYLDFKKGEAIMFQKGETLNASEDNDDSADDEFNNERHDMYEIKDLIEAKLKFLVQRLPPVPPVQQLSIELQTLWNAMVSGALKIAHMREWLQTADTTLGRLEASAAPHPWICRFHSAAGCYVYEHTETGQCQWEYPETEVPPPPATPPAEKPPIPPSPPPDEPTDMDISTTPPPSSHCEIRLHYNDDMEPLPPGIETSSNKSSSSDANNTLPKNLKYTSLEKHPSNVNDVLCAELSSFYSDLAALEENIPVSKVEKQSDKSAKNITNPVQAADIPSTTDKDKKKKSKAVKTNLGMKNKSVSKLVAKWKKVQESLAD